jgi:hypothetical protein
VGGRWEIFLPSGVGWLRCTPRTGFGSTEGASGHEFWREIVGGVPGISPGFEPGVGDEWWRVRDWHFLKVSS